MGEPITIDGITRNMGARMSERGPRVFVFAGHFGPQEFEELGVAGAGVLQAGAGADGAALEACDGFVDHGADGAVFVAADDAGAARAVEEDAGVHEVEVVAQWHEAEGALGIDEVVYGGENGFGGVEAFVDESGVAYGADVVDEDAC
jgi:hypothetical protein